MANEFRRKINASWADKTTNLSPTLFNAAIFSQVALEVHLSSLKRRSQESGMCRVHHMSPRKRGKDGAKCGVVPGDDLTLKGAKSETDVLRLLITAKSCKMSAQTPPIVTSSKKEMHKSDDKHWQN